MAAAASAHYLWTMEGRLMAGLIEEIQGDATDEKVPVVQLLRRMKVAAAKLKLPEIVAWVDHELNGYPRDEDCPPYRVLAGTPMVHLTGRGWSVWSLGQEEQMNVAFSVYFATGPIAENESHANSTGPIFMAYPEWLERNTLPHLVRADRIAIAVDQAKFKAILNGVRNKALDWALAIEAEGVTGEGLSFTPEETKAAQSVTTVNFHGANSRYNNNSTDESTNTVVHGDVFGDLRSNIREAVADTAQQIALIEAVDMMEKTKNTSAFAAAYAKFMGLAADHIQVLQWAIPMLIAYVNAPN